MGPVRDSAEAGALLSIALNFRYSAAKAAVVGYRLAWPTTRRRAFHPPTASAFAWRLGFCVQSIHGLHNKPQTWLTRLVFFKWG